jgi:hypothetical protein
MILLKMLLLSTDSCPFHFFQDTLRDNRLKSLYLRYDHFFDLALPSFTLRPGVCQRLKRDVPYYAPILKQEEGLIVWPQ